MRASVSPGKITHTHSQWEGTYAVYSSPPQNLNGKKGFILPRLADERPRHIFHLSNSLLTLRVYGCTEPVYIQSMYVFLYMSVCSRNKKPSASSWLGLELREFGHYAMKTCQTCTSLAERGGVRAKPPHIQHAHRSQITKVATLLNFHHWRELFLWLYQTCVHKVCVYMGVLLFPIQSLGLGVVKHADSMYRLHSWSAVWDLRVAWSTFLTVK